MAKKKNEKIVDLSKDHLKTIEYLLSNLNDVANEIKFIGKGKIFEDQFNRADGFSAILNDDLKIIFRRAYFQNYVADISFCYKGVSIMTSKIISDNGHWNGHPKSIKLMDAYERENSRHDLEKSFDMFIKWMKTTIVDQMIEKSISQKLYKDLLYDEYLDTLNS